MMSARVSLKLVSFENKYNFSTKNLKPDDFDPQMLDDMVDIIAMICQKSSKKISIEDTYYSCHSQVFVREYYRRDQNIYYRKSI
jgi:hypothetical protein